MNSAEGAVLRLRLRLRNHIRQPRRQIVTIPPMMLPAIAATHLEEVLCGDPANSAPLGLPVVSVCKDRLMALVCASVSVPGGVDSMDAIEVSL